MEKVTKIFLLPLSIVFITYLFFELGKHSFDINEIVGIIITIIGYIIWIVGRYNLGKGYSITPQAQQLITAGIYKKIRHPVYLGELIVLVGVIIFIDNHALWFMFILVFALQLFRKYQEEKVLLKKYGEQYLEYKKGTWF